MLADLWVGSEDKEAADSLEKLQIVQGICEQLGVWTQPHMFGAVCVVPIYTWYDTLPSPNTLWIPAPGLFSDDERLWTDYHMCKWPPQLPKDRVTGILHRSTGWHRSLWSLASHCHLLPFPHARRGARQVTGDKRLQALPEKGPELHRRLPQLLPRGRLHTLWAPDCCTLSMCPHLWPQPQKGILHK